MALGVLIHLRQLLQVHLLLVLTVPYQPTDVLLQPAVNQAVPDSVDWWHWVTYKNLAMAPPHPQILFFILFHIIFLY